MLIEQELFIGKQDLILIYLTNILVKKTNKVYRSPLFLILSQILRHRRSSLLQAVLHLLVVSECTFSSPRFPLGSPKHNDGKSKFKSDSRGQRASATKLITDAKSELAKVGGRDLVTLGVLHGKLTEKLSKIRMLDEQVLEAMSENEDIEQEALTQDEKAVEIELAIGNLLAMLRGDEHEVVEDQRVIKMYKASSSFRSWKYVGLVGML